jgi:hypothetical protein
MTLTGERAGSSTEAHYLTVKLGSVCKLLIIGSYGFPIVLRELGTRHAFTQRSNPVETGAPPLLRQLDRYDCNSNWMLSSAVPVRQVFRISCGRVISGAPM